MTDGHRDLGGLDGSGGSDADRKDPGSERKKPDQDDRANRQRRRAPRPGRARQRAIRAQAAESGVAYSVAARQLDACMAPGETLASQGRTVYPSVSDGYRRWSVDARDRRSFDERVRDTRQAAMLPGGRAQHLAERFPPTRGAPGSGVGLLYHGDGREDALAMLYMAVAHEAPGLVPAIGELAWIAEMGEETALDTACAELDRTARRLLDCDRRSLWQRIETALLAGVASDDWRIRQEAARLNRMYRAMMSPHEGHDGQPYVTLPPLDGVRHILDAVLIVADDGHAPGTRVRMLTTEHSGSTGTIVGVRWGATGPPVGYEVCPDGTRTAVPVEPGRLVVLAGQERVPR